MKTWRAWMDKNMPGANQADANYTFAYSVSSLMLETLKRCGDTLTRENVMKQAAGFKKFELPIVLPGITINTSPDDYYPIQAVQLARFKGESWSCSVTSCTPRAAEVQRSLAGARMTTSVSSRTT